VVVNLFGVEISVSKAGSVGISGFWGKVELLENGT